MPMIGSPNTHARNHRLPRSFRATLIKIAHLMIRCRTGDPLLFRMTRNSRLMLSILVGLSPSLAPKLTLYRGQGAGFASIHFIYAVCGNSSLGLFIMPLFTRVRGRGILRSSKKGPDPLVVIEGVYTLNLGWVLDCRSKTVEVALVHDQETFCGTVRCS